MPVLQWGMLCVLSLLLSIGFLGLHLPAALLLGPMLAGIIFSMRGVTLQLPRSAFLAAQAILGCMIAQNLTGSILTTLAVVAGTAGCLLRLPSGTMLIPMLAGAVLQSGQLITIELPEWLLAMAYMAIGWRIGLGFDKQILLRALRPLPQILLSIFALLAICAGMAWGLTRFMHIDFMTAYLATSPGGLDTVAVIAAGSNADMALIMAMQTLRLFSILLTGPAIARFISTYAPKRSA
ncbi:AbrB family transcriptional regulator [Escherichia coli]|uniref:AbrB family transcriptional regulator n=1 Tax=Escherichia coli TaxID=562 RepID=UPI000BE4516E|nr:AbrB family transcriptional regulator [Escherichia coli]MBB2364117.1 AbrB family transcriptional regulator [Escherichia coli]